MVDRRTPYIQCSKLDVGVLVAYPALQGAHGLFRLHCLGANDIGYLEVEGHVLAGDGQQRFGCSPDACTHRLEEVARSICSSSALLEEVPNHPAMMVVAESGMRGRRECPGVCGVAWYGVVWCAMPSPQWGSSSAVEVRLGRWLGDIDYSL